jgi:hypothetical protein
LGTGANLDLIAYALVATLTPLGFAATLAVIESGRVQAFAFAFGLVAAQLATCAFLVAVGTSFVPDRDRDRPVLRATFELCFGLALLGLSAIARRRPETSDAAGTGGRGTAVLERLRRIRPTTALAAGVLLGIGGPKRLILTALAAASVAAVYSQTSDAWTLVIAYTLVATLLVWAPIAAFEVGGARTLKTLHDAQRGLGRHQRALTFYSLVSVGLLAIVDALVTLL